jgi:hypothetical protein
MRGLKHPFLAIGKFPLRSCSRFCDDTGSDISRALYANELSGFGNDTLISAHRDNLIHEKVEAVAIRAWNSCRL